MVMILLLIPHLVVGRMGQPVIPQNKWVVVTGASSGIGSAMAERAAKDGLCVVLCGRKRGALNDIARRLERDFGVSTEVVLADLSTRHGAQRVHRKACRSVARRGGSIEALAANAGVCFKGAFVTQEIDELDALISVNIRSLVIACRLFGNDFCHAGAGHIVLTGSIAGMSVGVGGVACYAATKAFVRSFAHALRTELRPRVSVTALLPGAVDTNFAIASGLERTLIFRIGPRLPGGFVMDAREAVRGIDFRVAHRRRRDGEIVPGLANKIFAAVATYMPSPVSRAIATAAFSTSRS